MEWGSGGNEKRYSGAEMTAFFADLTKTGYRDLLEVCHVGADVYNKRKSSGLD